MSAPLLISPTSTPSRPGMPTPYDEERSAKQSARWSVLTEDFEPLLIQWMETRVDAQRLAAWGPPDTSSNVLSDMSRQFTTPGLYGSRPEVFHADVTNQGLVGPGGRMDVAGYWTLMQWVQYATVGMGDFLLRADADEDGLLFRVVLPQNVYVYASPERPDKPIVLWELRLRHVLLPTEKDGRWMYCWDQYDTGERLPGGVTRPPSYRVVSAGRDGADFSALFLGAEGGLVGEAYPYTHADGKPFLPFPVYRAVDSKSTWNHLHKVGAMRGTLNASTHWTYAGHCARDASGRAVLAAGLVPIGGDVQNSGDPSAIRSVQLSPGAILYHQVQDGSQPFVHEVGPGGNLTEVAEFAITYEAKQLARWGIASDDVKKSSADPASGAALFISRQGKREYANQVKPLFERADLEAIRVCASLLRLAGHETYAEEGYSISYAEIAKTRDEEEAEREELDWDLEHGHVSEVQAYMRRHPGTREEDAIAALTRAAVEKARLQRALEDALAAAGLAAAPAPASPGAAAPPPPADPADEPTPAAPPPVATGADRPTIELTSTDIAGIVTVNEARASQGLPPIEGPDGELTVTEYQAKHAAVTAAAAAAASGEPVPPTPQE